MKNIDSNLVQFAENVKKIVKNHENYENKNAANKLIKKIAK